MLYGEKKPKNIIISDISDNRLSCWGKNTDGTFGRIGRNYTVQTALEQ